MIIRHSLFFFLLLSLPIATKAQIKIGISAPLSGEGSTFGQDLKNIISFANKKLANNKYTLVVEDDLCSGKGGITVAQRLTNIEKVKAVFMACDTAAMTAAPVYKKGGVLVFTPLVTISRYSNLGKTFFRLAPNDAENARILVDYIHKRNKKLGIITEAASEYSENLAQEIETNASKVGLTTVNESFPAGTLDYRSILLKLRSKEIDSLLVNPNSEGPFIAILKQVKEQGINVPIFGSYAPGSASFIKNAGNLAEEIVYTDFPSFSSMAKEGNALLEEYRHQYGPLNSWDFILATGFESFRVMHAALESPLQDKSSFIRAVTFKGLFGEYFFNEQGDVPTIKNDLLKITNGIPIKLN